MKRSKGFTLIELLVVVAIIALLVSILLPSLSRARELAKRAMCSGNLNMCGKGFHLYFNENNDKYPLLSAGGAATVSFAAQAGATLQSNTKVPYSNPWVGNEYGTSCQANIWLLYYNKYVGSEKGFLCPSTADEPTNRDPNANGKPYGIGSAANVSYGIQVCFTYMGSTGTADYNAAALGPKLDGGVAIMADELAANGTADATKPSTNHNQEGESVLFHGGYVQWGTKNGVGYNDNNIYAKDLDTNGNVQQGATGVSKPDHGNDSIIVNVMQ